VQIRGCRIFRGSRRLKMARGKNSRAVFPWAKPFGRKTRGGFFPGGFRGSLGKPYPGSENRRRKKSGRLFPWAGFSGDWPSRPGWARLGWVSRFGFSGWGKMADFRHFPAGGVAKRSHFWAGGEKSGGGRILGLTGVPGWARLQWGEAQPEGNPTASL